MITKDNLTALLTSLNFTTANGELYSKHFDAFDCALQVDFKAEKLIYPVDKGLIIDAGTTSNFSQPESFVVFECVHRLLEKGYPPNHIELERTFSKIKTEDGGGRADIIVKNNDNKVILIIECKTAGTEFNKHWAKTKQDGDQLFRYLTNKRETEFLCLYTSDWIDDKLIPEYRLITLQDNQDYLNENPKLISFKEAKTKNKEDIFRVWVETYGQHPATLGLFEKDSGLYENIGKKNFNLADLKGVTSQDIQGKYNEFATILRMHNVSGRENAFDKLVNLFLCKVVDERAQSDLSFYWKSIAYDNPFSLQDRLQKLYKIGMKDFLNQEITYIEEKQIREAFRFVSENDPDATLKQIQRYFRQLKFFTNNDFAFIDVHNEALFHKNFAVLLKTVQMLQDIRLTDSEENQFLGDMFEGFLDQGVKQSEGQFFTPMPIVKFLLNSLPLANLLEDDSIPQVIDYACGAGHFLNEYANQIKSYIQDKDKKIFHEAIIGIEKEYRLSKVAKVSAFMYGQGDINIVYEDALALSQFSRCGTIKENSFDLLVANPPYSVKGFLNTLTEDDRQQFELIKHIDAKNYDKNNSIECFFIERAKQLLKPNGMAAIILPSSILDKDSIYIPTREIIIKYFDIIAIAAFGSGTFGKTGTNTVTLFLRKKSDNPPISEHYYNRVNQWFKGNMSDSVYEDSHFIEAYCQYVSFSKQDYIAMLQGSLSDGFMALELVQEYIKKFNAMRETKDFIKRIEKIEQKNKKEDQDSEEIAALKAKEIAALKAKIEQNKINFIKEKEKEKLLYFMLATANAQPVIVVKAPTDNKENKQFLGYDWSSRKGNEGIKYITNTNTNTTLDDNLDEDDKRILSNLTGLSSINTPLYNPHNRDDTSKINKIIQDNFNGINATIPEALTPYVTRVKLTDMLDFSHVEFNKAISLNTSKKVEIESKYPLVSIGDYAKLVTKGTTPTTIGFNFVNSGINFVKIESISPDGQFDREKFAFIENDCHQKMLRSQLQEHDILFSIAGALGRSAIVSKEILPANTNQAIAIIRLNNINNLLVRYVYLALQSSSIQAQLDFLKVGIAQQNLSLSQISALKIPLPPLSIQQQIVDECQAVDDEVNAAKATISTAKADIEQIMNNVQGDKVKLSSIAITNPSKREISTVNENTIVSFIEMASVSNDAFIETKVDRPLKELKKGSFTYFKENDIIIAKITPSMENGKCALATGLTNNLGMGSSEFHVIRVDELTSNKFIFFFLNRNTIRNEAEKRMTGASGHRRVPITFYEDLEIPLPPLAEQQTIASKIEALKTKITQAQAIIDNSKARKEAVLKQYL